MEQRLLNIAELAVYLSTSKGSIYTMVCMRKIPPECVVHIGRALRFEKDAVDRWVDSQRGDASKTVAAKSVNTGAKL